MFDYLENWKMHWKDKEIAENLDVRNNVCASLDYMSFMSWTIIALYNVLFFLDLNTIYLCAITFDPYAGNYLYKLIVKLYVSYYRANYKLGTDNLISVLTIRYIK